MTKVSNVRQSPVICLSVHVKTCSFLRALRQVTSPESTCTTWRQNSNCNSGRVPRLHDHRRGARCEAKQRFMLPAFFDSEGIVHHEYTPDGQTINKEFYMEVLRCLHKTVCRKRPEKWRDSNWILHHNNAPAL